MKKIIKALAAIIFISFFLVSCGERGPVGPPGPPGPDILPTSFEFNASLSTGNNFEFFSDIPAEIEVLDSDVVLAFVLEDYIEQDDLEVWRQLPITEFNSRGTVLFNFDFTFVDVRVFLDASYPLTASDGYQDVLIRAVHIPADFAAKMKENTLTSVQSPEELEKILGLDVRQL